MMTRCHRCNVSCVRRSTHPQPSPIVNEPAEDVRTESSHPTTTKASHRYRSHAVDSGPALCKLHTRFLAARFSLRYRTQPAISTDEEVEEEERFQPRR